MTSRKSEKKIDYTKDYKDVEDCHNHPECIFFKHGEEGTHFACLEVIHRDGIRAKCCGCERHKCKK